jgi:hypothetical protein
MQCAKKQGLFLEKIPRKGERNRCSQPVTLFISALRAPRHPEVLPSSWRKPNFKDGSRDALEFALVDSSPTLN